MIQITPQMRVLVAIERVDGRNYALSLDMRSRVVATSRTGLLRGLGQRITRTTSSPEAWQATCPADGSDRVARSAGPMTPWPLVSP
jgi:hypothetical protein